MRYLLLVFAFLGLSVAGWSQTTYAPNSTSSMAGGATYCQNVTPGLLTYTYNTCQSGTGAAEGVPLTITWYSNTVNSTTGGTMQSITFVSSSTAATGNTTFLPSTFDAGTTYYYCVITWDGTGRCNTSGTLTSPTATVVVNTTPDVITGATSACVGTTTTLANAVGGGTWTSSATARATINSSTGVLSAVASGVATISYTLGSCRSTLSFTVNANPSAVAGTNSICENATTTFSDATAGGTWSIADAGVATISGSSPVTITGVNSGTTTVSYTLGTGCYATRLLTINNAPGSITGTLSACVGTQSTLSNAEVGGTWTSTTTARATITSGGVVSAVSAGTSVISYTIGSCRTTSTFTVNANPVAISGTNSICENATTTFSDATASGTWSIADAGVATISGSSPVTITGINSGTTTVSYTLGTGCYATRPLTINNAPASIAGTLVACVGNQSTLSNTEPGGTWTSATTTRATITAGGVVSAVSAGTSVISYTIGSCRTTSIFTVNAVPSAITGTNSICENATTSFSDVTAGGTWSIADPATATISGSGPITISGLNSGSTTISYTLGTGCYATRGLTVNNAPGPIMGTLSACVGTQSTLSNSEAGGTWVSATATKATITSDGVVSAVASGTSVISYTIGSCRSTATFTVNANPNAPTGTNTICENATTTFSSTTAGGTWSIDNPGIATLTGSNTITITGLSSGSSALTYTLPTGCYATRSLTVNDAPAAITGSAFACPGGVSTLSNTEPGGTWTSGTTSRATITSDGVVTAVSAGTSTISYTIGSCRSSVVFTINPNPANISGTQTVCRNATTIFSDATASGTWSTSNASVATIDGSSPVNITGVAPGTATITYTLPTSCFAVRNVTVNQAPDAIVGPTSMCIGTNTTFTNAIASGTWASSSSARASISSSTGFTRALSAGAVTISYSIGTCRALLPITVETAPAAITGTASVCVGQSTTLANTTAFGSWSTSDAAVATVNEATGVVTGISAGIANITYATGCGADAVQAVTVNTTPVAISGTLQACAGNSVTLSNLVEGGTWSGGTAEIATITSDGTVTAIAEGTTAVTYTIGSCLVSSNFTVNPNPAAITGDNEICLGTSTTFDNVIASGTWSVADEAVATISGSAPLNINSVAAGNTTISYTLGTGCYATRSLTVYPNPEAISGATQVCQGFSITLDNATPGGTWSVADEAVATIDGGTPVTVTSLTVGSSNISYTLPSGCYATHEITVNANPDVITGIDQVCVGATVTLADATAEGTWSTSNGSVASIDAGSPVTVSGVTAGSVDISYTLATGCYITRSLTVNPNPDAIAGASSVCQGSTITLSDATESGTWSISDETVATIDGASPVTVTGLLSGSATVSYTLPTGCYATSVVTVNMLPVAHITSADDACYNYATTVVVSGTSGATLTYKVDGGADVTTTLTGGTASISTGVITSAHTYQLTYVETPSCGSVLDTTVNINVIPMQWVGGAFTHETDWNTAANWSCGFVPDYTTDVTIPSGLTYYPELAAASSALVNNLTVQAGATVGIDADGILAVKGNLSNNGTFVGDGNVSMNGSTAQTISGLGTYSNLALSNSAGASVAAASRVIIIKALNIEVGTFNTNDSLVLYSNAVGNARVSSLPSGAGISGNVKVMQYVPGGYRRYRFWSHPLASDISLSQIQTYIDITGIGGSANGFTTTASNNPSAFRYDPLNGNSALSSDPGWKAFTKINSSAADSNLFHRYQGIRLFIRGTKGQGLGYISETPNPVTISVVGALNQGNLSIPLSKGSSANQEYNMVGNPYPSPVDIGTVIYNAKQAGKLVGSAFYVWNPYIGIGGGYITVPIGVGAASPYYIQANTAFQVRAAYNGATLDFTESRKGADYDVLVLKPASEYVTLQVVDGAGHPWDYTRVAFNNSATTDVDDEYDAAKLSGSDLSFYSLSADGKPLAIDARPYSSNEVIPLGLSTSYAQQYTIRVEEAAIPAGKTLYLNDKLMNKSIEVTQGSEYTFNVTTDNASQGENRFELSAKPAASVVKPVTVSLAPNPATDIVALTFAAPTAENLSVRVMDVTGATVFSQHVGSTSSTTVNIPLKNFAAGTYMVEVTYGKNKSVQKLVKE